MNEGKRTFQELLIGIAFFGVLFIIPGFFWPNDKVAYYLGLVGGILVSLYLVYDMYTSLEKGLSMDEDSASNYFRKKTIIRIGVIAIVFFVAVFVKRINLLSLLFGALTLKFSAYLQPLTNKLNTKLSKGR